MHVPAAPFEAILWPTFVMFLNGAFVTLGFVCFETLRRDTLLKTVSVLYLLLCLGVYVQQLPMSPTDAAVSYWGFMAASSSSLPVFVYAALSFVLGVMAYFGRPRSREHRQLIKWQQRLRRALRRGDLRLLEEKLQEVREHPTHPTLRSQLIDLYLGLGETENALYHAYALVEMLPRGHAHGFALYRLSQIIAERQKQLPEAQPYLRRIIRLYPRSFFASYARRLVNQYEAYANR
ncbi:MAG: hypothetical protein AAF581_00905 [Planctomycetota bacterium]